jgi:HTH-type transcriptional regulator, transcriptional repressor of NAD biosynthesis genes
MSDNILKIKQNLKSSTGLVFGKFYPFHTGHQNLVNFARNRCDDLIVLVCASDREKISCQQRANWIRETYSTDHKIRVLEFSYSEDDLPNSSVSSREISKLWANCFLKILEPIEVVFTAEDYGDYLAEFMDIRHERFNSTKAISATMIRRDIKKYWEFINQYAQPTLVRKVVLLGTESTGKSTMAEHLARLFDTELVPEVGRDMIPNSSECTQTDLFRVAKAHAEIIEKKMQIARRLIIIDTDLHITQSYSRFLFNSEICVSSEIIELNKADLYLYLDNDAPYVQDGTRLDRIQRDALDSAHKSYIDQIGLNYTLLTGSFDEKYHKAERLVSNLIPSGL